MRKGRGNVEKKLKSFEEIKNGMKNNTKTIEQINDSIEKYSLLIDKIATVLSTLSGIEYINIEALAQGGEFLEQMTDFELGILEVIVDSIKDQLEKKAAYCKYLRSEEYKKLKSLSE